MAKLKRNRTKTVPGGQCSWCEKSLAPAGTTLANGAPSLAAESDAPAIAGRRTPGIKRFCSQKCRQAAFRLRRIRTTERLEGPPLRFAYADPPYPGKSFYYRGHPDYQGEVDHPALIASLAGFDGWSLSTSPRSLRDVLPLCPKRARVCAWVKPIGVSSICRANTGTGLARQMSMDAAT